MANRRYSEPVIKQEPIDIDSSSQILNLTSIFSPQQSYNFPVKEEPSCQWYVTQAQGLTPSGPTYSPGVEKSPLSRPQVICQRVCICLHPLIVIRIAHFRVIVKSLHAPPPFFVMCIH